MRPVYNLAFKQKAECSEEVSHVDIGGRSVLGRGNSRRQVSALLSITVRKGTEICLRQWRLRKLRSRETRDPAQFLRVQGLEGSRVETQRSGCGPWSLPLRQVADNLRLCSELSCSSLCGFLRPVFLGLGRFSFFCKTGLNCVCLWKWQRNTW